MHCTGRSGLRLESHDGHLQDENDPRIAESAQRETLLGVHDHLEKHTACWYIR